MKLKTRSFLGILVLILILTGTLFAANSDSQHTIPIKSVSTSGGLVSPNTPIIIELDTNHSNWSRVKNQFEASNFTVTLNDVEIPSEYDPVTNKITAYPEVLERYTHYSLNILIKSNLNGNGKNEKPAFDFPIEFETGSNVGEPTKGRIIVDNNSPRVTENCNVTIELFDDYGNPATIPSNIKFTVVEDGQRLQNSFIISPNNVNSILAQQHLAVSNKEAEKVLLTAEISYEDIKFNLTTEINFRPGVPALFDFEVPTTIKAGEDALINGSLTDIYGNLVETGETVSVSNNFSSAIDTIHLTNANLQYHFTAPTKSGEYTLTFTSGNVQKTLNFIVVANDPTNMQLEYISQQGSIQGKVLADNKSTAMIKATVTDKYGNLCDGSVAWLDSMGLIQQTTASLTQGSTTTLIKSNTPGVNTITCSIGEITKSIEVEFIPVPSIELTVIYPTNAVDKKIPADGTSVATIIATVTDPQGKPYPYIGSVAWSTTMGQLSSNSGSLINGNATTTIKSNTVGTATVSVNVGGITKSIQIQFENLKTPIILVGDEYSISGNAASIGFNINTDGRFWIVREDNSTLYTTILNTDNTVYKQNIQNPLRSYWTGSRLIFYNSESSPSIAPDGNGNMLLAWTRYYNGFNLMGTYYKADGTMGNGANYYMMSGGDYRDPYLYKNGRNVEIVWTNNVNGGYSTIKTEYGRMFANSYSGVSVGHYSTINTSGRAYDPSIAFDSKGNRWVFQTRTNGIQADLVYVKNDLSEKILEAKVGGANSTAIACEDEIWVAYVHNGDILIRTISSNEVISQPYTVTQGKSPVLAKDNSGNIWLAWIKPNGTVSYSQISK